MTFVSFLSFNYWVNSWFPLGLENLKKWKGLFQSLSEKSREILLRLEKTENFTQNTRKFGKNYTGKLKKKNTGKVGGIYQLVKVKTTQYGTILQIKIKTFKKYWKSRKFVSLKKWEPRLTLPCLKCRGI